MAQTLPLLTKISQATAGSTTYRWKVAQFGGGYSQRTPDGINYQGRKYSIVYDNLTAAELTTMITFFDHIGTGAYFNWTPPGYAVPLKWVLDGGVNISARSGDLYNIVFSCKQTFDLN